MMTKNDGLKSNSFNIQLNILTTNFIMMDKLYIFSPVLMQSLEQYGLFLALNCFVDIFIYLLFQKEIRGIDFFCLKKYEGFLFLSKEIREITNFVKRNSRDY